MIVCALMILLLILILTYTKHFRHLTMCAIPIAKCFRMPIQRDSLRMIYIQCHLQCGFFFSNSSSEARHHHPAPCWVRALSVNSCLIVNTIDSLSISKSLLRGYIVDKARCGQKEFYVDCKFPCCFE